MRAKGALFMSNETENKSSSSKNGEPLALGAGFGVALGAGIGAAFGEIEIGVALGAALGTGVCVAILDYRKKNGKS